MIGQRLAQYVIVARIGAGGMGEVFRARDERLERDVAIKVLPAGLLTDEAARKRFRKEALALAKLNHPNIATIHDFNSQDGVDFLVMGYVPGSSLAEKLAAGPLSEMETLRLGAQVAAALEEAHEHGIIHRDLKPGNILLTSRGNVKVLDFGLAKLLQPTAAEAVTAESLAETHAGAGTLPYMAPEQLRGEPLDTRTDVHGLGAVLYEMCTGQRPFPETQGPRLIDAILHQAPVPPSRLNPRLAAQLETVILKALEKDPERRYQSARELRVDLERLATPATTPAPVTRPGGLRRRVIPMAAAIVLLLSALVAFNLGGLRHRLFGRGTPQIQSLAVLPLENLSGDPKQEYFADGMTEALITELAQLSGLKKVTSRTSVMQFKKKDKSIPEIAGILKVDAIIEGSVTRYGDQVRITVQLIHGETDRHLWAKSFDRELRNVLALHSEIAQDIARQVNVVITPSEASRLTGKQTVNPEAYRLYLQGRYFWHRSDEPSLIRSLDYFQQSTQADPSYAPAFVGMAEAYKSLGYFASYPSHEVMPRAKEAAQKALALDPALGSANATLAAIMEAFDWDWGGAESRFRRAIELNPNDATARQYYGEYLWHTGRPQEAVLQLQRAYEIDPLSLAVRVALADALRHADRFNEGINLLATTLEMDPNFAQGHFRLGTLLRDAGRLPEAIREFETAVKLSDGASKHRANLIHALALASRRNDALKELKALEESLKKVRYISPFDRALIHIGFGEKEKAFYWLERAFQERASEMLFLKAGPYLGPLRDDPRFQELVRRMNFP